MAKGKKENDQSQAEHDVLIGYIHSWVYTTPSGDLKMSGHPKSGRCYRLIKDSHGYRLHIGRENNEAGLDGLFLGPELVAERKDFAFDIEVITPDNILSLDITKEDSNIIANWVQDENKDLWDKIKLEIAGAVPVVRSMNDLMDLMSRIKEEEATADGSQLPTTVITDTEDDFMDRSADVISSSLNSLSEEDPGLITALSVALDFIASTTIKNNTTTLSTFSNSIAVNTDMGMGANIFSTVKLLERYCSDDESSDNIQDIYSAIHYLLFEIQRRQNKSKFTSNE